MKKTSLLSVAIKYEQDIVAIRQRARTIAEMLGFETRDQAAISTAVSELARNAYKYAGGGTGEFYLQQENGKQVFFIRISDHGRGIDNLNHILDGAYISPTGMGMGIIGSRRLMDTFEIDSSPGKGTTILIGKFIPFKQTAFTGKEISAMLDRLVTKKPENVYEELKYQNNEILITLEELKKKQDELELLNKELEDTNRGVVALYAELDERAEHLKRMSEIKGRFYSNMSHEFKTPLNSILALSRILLNRIDGEINEEQEKQVKFIQKSANDLLELVNDLLDISKAEAGKLEIKPSVFSINDMFATLKGILKPLLTNPDVSLSFQLPEELPLLNTDEGKLSQILRNFISNALKFTEKGEIKVKADADKTNSRIIFSVADTGIGIAEKDIDYIFEEFTQIDSSIQKKYKGTGLGLPLSHKLAVMLGGEVWVESSLGRGSSFYVSVPAVFPKTAGKEDEAPEQNAIYFDVKKHSVIIIDSNPDNRTMFNQHLAGSDFYPYFAGNINEANDIMHLIDPYAVIISVEFPNKNASFQLKQIRNKVINKKVPFVIFNILFREPVEIYEHQGIWINNTGREQFLYILNNLSSARNNGKLLIIDDQEISRYLIKELLAGQGFIILEADDGKSGIKTAISEQPDVIILDLNMPGLSGYEVLAELKSNNQTTHIPVVINTSKELSADELKSFSGIAALISKHVLTEDKASQVLKDILIRSAAVIKPEFQ